MQKNFPTTPDGRYFLVQGRLWRCTNSALTEDRKAELVSELMTDRRILRNVASGSKAEKAARTRVHAAKVALGERGPVWWSDGAGIVVLPSNKALEQGFVTIASTRCVRARGDRAFAERKSTLSHRTVLYLHPLLIEHLKHHGYQSQHPSENRNVIAKESTGNRRHVSLREMQSRTSHNARLRVQRWVRRT